VSIDDLAQVFEELSHAGQDTVARMQGPETPAPSAAPGNAGAPVPGGKAGAATAFFRRIFD
jgi:hypothetical protein